MSEYAARPVSFVYGEVIGLHGLGAWPGSKIYHKIHDSSLFLSLVCECTLQGWQLMFYCPEVAMDKSNVLLRKLSCLLEKGAGGGASG